MIGAFVLVVLLALAAISRAIDSGEQIEE